MDFKKYFQKMVHAVCSLDENDLQKAVKLIQAVIKRKGKIILAGNGASAAIASHVAVDFSKAAGVRAINFNEADLLTCLANDYGYEHWVEKALDLYADPKDLVILISSSGMSPNILNAAREAKNLGLPLITFSGFQPRNKLRKMGVVNFWVNSKEYNVVETAHQAGLLALVDYFVFKRKM